MNLKTQKLAPKLGETYKRMQDREANFSGTIHVALQNDSPSKNICRFTFSNSQWKTTTCTGTEEGIILDVEDYPNKKYGMLFFEVA